MVLYGDTPADTMPGVLKEAEKPITLVKVPHHSRKGSPLSGLYKDSNPKFFIISRKTTKPAIPGGFYFCNGEPSATRTRDALIKSYVLRDAAGTYVVKIVRYFDIYHKCPLAEKVARNDIQPPSCHLLTIGHKFLSILCLNLALYLIQQFSEQGNSQLHMYCF